MNHLGDEQLAQWLAGEASPETESHLQSCDLCRAEATALRDGISRYTLAIRQQSSLAQSSHITAGFTLRKALVIHRLRWAAAGVLALVLATPTAWILRSHPPATPYPGVASTPATSATEAAAPHSTPSASPLPPPSGPSAASISDDQLLEEVSNDLNREIPQALAPVSVITTARNEIAANKFEPLNRGNVSDLQGESK